MKRIKKAQKGYDSSRDELGRRMTPAQKKKQQEAELKMIDYPGRPAMPEINYKGGPKKVVPKKKAKKGGSFPDLTGDGKVTRADILKGRGVIKNGGKLKKQAAVAIAMKKAGKSPKKARNGAKLGPSKSNVSSMLGSYKRTIGKNISGKKKK